MNVKLHIEALIFASDKPVTIKEIKNCLNSLSLADLSNKEIEDIIQEIKEKYDNENFAIQIKTYSEWIHFHDKI